MKQKLVSILLIGSFFISTANFVFPYASYYANYHYFAVVACIHKNQPQMHCNGSCQLKRMLKKERKDSATNNSQTKVDHSIRKDFFCGEIYAFLNLTQKTGQTLPSIDDSIHSLFVSSPPSPPPQLV